MEKQDWFLAIGQAVFAMLAASVKWLTSSDKQMQTARNYVSGVASAALAGVFVYLLYAWTHMDAYLAFATAGAVGYLGANGLDFVMMIITRQLQVRTGGIDKSPADTMNKNEQPPDARV